MSGNHNETKKHNLDFLTNDLGLEQLKPNSTVFEKDDIFVLSPLVIEGTSIFDIREVDLNMFDIKNYRVGLLILRIVQEDKFLIVELNELSEIIGEYFNNFKKEGITWRFQINGFLNNFSDSEYQGSTMAYISNENNKNIKPVQSVFLNKDDVVNIFEDYLVVNI